MGLVEMKGILQKAEQGQYGVGAFSVANMEMVLGAIQAAEELRSPLIIQIAEVRLSYSPLHLIGPMMVEAAREATVPVAVHFDHGLTREKIKQALDIGFTSVMFDGSHFPLKENIKRTKQIVELVKPFGATVEAEIGQVGGSEDGTVDTEVSLTDIEEAKQFAMETQVDALAIAIGNAHGIYKGKPCLQLDHLEAIHEQVDLPLVLHGGSGIDPHDFKKCIQHGIRKINVATATFNQVIHQVNKETPYRDYFSHHRDVIMATTENVKHHIKIFGSDYKV
ncbi:class II fructose-bisphosphate aldolase [Shimazuella kribbensis]|uniref:class II fructose-bisphosphate aldolase n=1 Tax=Shimazuella kribbensis TaxID=139808 RepID=UPI0004241254|nr:class II fructose-bisphosphate aldolase [Shimazuella kribbensis]